jgi:hypothetical protein
VIIAPASSQAVVSLSKASIYSLLLLRLYLQEEAHKHMLLLATSVLNQALVQIKVELLQFTKRFPEALPTAVFRLAIDALDSAVLHIAVFSDDFTLCNTLLHIAIFELPPLFARSAHLPIQILPCPVVIEFQQSFQISIFDIPVVILFVAQLPIHILVGSAVISRKLAIANQASLVTSFTDILSILQVQVGFGDTDKGFKLTARITKIIFSVPIIFHPAVAAQP